MNMPLRHAVFSGELSLRNVSCSVPGANFSDLFMGQFGPAVRFAGVPSLTVFPCLVRHVVKVIANKQMGHIAASPTVATMQDMHAVGDWTVRQNPCKTVNAYRMVPGKKYVPISPVVDGASPKPTIVGAELIDFQPETFSNGAGFGARRGMIVHVTRSFQRLTMPRAASNSAAALLLLCISIIPRLFKITRRLEAQTNE